MINNSKASCKVDFIDDIHDFDFESFAMTEVSIIELAIFLACNTYESLWTVIKVSDKERLHIYKIGDGVTPQDVVQVRKIW